MAKKKIVPAGDVGEYEFTPGENGSLTYTDFRGKEPNVLDFNSVKQAKVIGPQDVVAKRQPSRPPQQTAEQLALRKRRSGIVNSLAVRD